MKRKPKMTNCRLPTKLHAVGIANKTSKLTTRLKIAVKAPPIRNVLPVPFLSLVIIVIVSPPVFTQYKVTVKKPNSSVLAA